MAPPYNRSGVMKRWAGLLLILLLPVTSFAQTSSRFAIGDGGGMSFETGGTASAPWLWAMPESIQILAPDSHLVWQ
jgi:hypothetical protein